MPGRGIAHSAAIGDKIRAAEYQGGFAMAKGQQRQPKEKKKPKAEGKTKTPSAYKQGYGLGGPSAFSTAMSSATTPKKT
jgi:hypothetical protein